MHRHSSNTASFFSVLIAALFLSLSLAEVAAAQGNITVPGFMRRRSIHSAASWISQRLMHEAMNTMKTSSGIVFSVFPRRESNASAAPRMGIRNFVCRGRLPEKSLMWQASGWLSSVGEYSNGRISPLL
jgi:hypothetical protein